MKGKAGQEILHRAHWENLCAQAYQRIQEGKDALDAIQQLMERVNAHFGITQEEHDAP